MGKTIETQTDNISPKQEAGERNRPLDERLAAQQKVLDHLLCSKLQQANGLEQNDLVPFTVSGADIAANGHGKAQHKCEQTMKPVTSASSSLAIQIESVPATMDRGPLSPLAA
ncbi:hypothetical protein DVH05_002174 [Phytophthora capsici]|nr:hypothetical protein DVH05_002174 [Phytophthora capsici]